MFAGITDTCGMAMILARMPWNQVSSVASPAGPACRIGAMLLAASVFGSAALQAAEAHTKDSLATVQRGIAEQKAVLVDVREKDEWEEGHLRDARLLPLSTLEKGVTQDDVAKILPQGKVIYLHCAAAAAVSKRRQSSKSKATTFAPSSRVSMI